MSVLGVVGFRVDATGNASNPSFRCSWGRTPTNKEGVQFNSKGLYLQRSTTVNSWPDLANAGTTPSYIVGTISARTTPLAQTGWTTIKTWNAADTAAMTANESFTDSLTAGTGLTAGQSMYAYRLIYFATLVGGLNPTYEVDYAPAAISTSAFSLLKNFGGSSSSDYAFATAVDGSGNFYLAGTFNGTMTIPGVGTFVCGGRYDTFVMKMDSTGTPIWCKQFGGTGGFNAGNVIQPSSIDVDSSGNVVFCGVWTHTVNLGGGDRTTASVYQWAYVVKLNSSGTYQWDFTYGAFIDCLASKVKFSSDGSIYLVGAGSPGIAPNQYFYIGPFQIYCAASLALITKLNSSGVPQWVKTASEGLALNPKSYGTCFDEDSGGNVYFGGWALAGANYDFGDGKFSSSSAFSFIAKYTSGGTLLWKRTIDTNNPGASSTKIIGIAIDSADNVFSAGQYQVSVDVGAGSVNAVGFDMFVVKYSGTDGSYVGAGFIHGGDTLSASVVNDLALDSSDQPVIVGTLGKTFSFFGKSFTGVNPSGEGFAAKLNNSMTACIWVFGFLPNDPNNISGVSKCIKLANQAVLLAGWCTGGCTFGGTAVPNNGGYDAVMIKVNL